MKHPPTSSRARPACGVPVRAPRARHPRARLTLARATLVGAAALASGGCELLSDSLSRFQNATGPRRLSDEDAFRHLARDRTAVAPQDVTAMMKAIDLEENRRAGRDATPRDPAVVDLLRRTVRPRLSIDEAAFVRIEPDVFEAAALAEQPGMGFKQGCSFDVSLGQLMGDQFLIPQLDKIPVRNQVARGTCAAFTGVAALEYAALNPQEGPAARLATLDLSEEYFYWSSKPECQSSSAAGDNCSGGSWYGRGFEASVSADGFDIPLESDCPYQAYGGDHETNHPLPGRCDRGALRVEQVDGFCGADGLVGLLHQGYAVPWASPLTQNWELTDGLITLAEATDAGQTNHSGGHAYLIVGYRRLPDMPEEGGMCFMIKNSWGTGWGVNGYACMTLAWMQRVTYDGFLSYTQPAVRVVSVRDDLATGTLPDDGDGGGGTNDDLPDDDQDDGLPPDEVDVEPEPEPLPEPPPEPDPNAWAPGRLRGPDDSWYRVETQVVDDQFFVRGEVLDANADGGRSRYLRLIQDPAGDLIYKGDVVGRVDVGGEMAGGNLRLCTAEWAHLCALRYRARDGQIYVQFRDDDLRSVKPEEVAADRGDWYQVRLGGNQYGLFVPSNVDTPEFLLDPKTYLRLGDREPVRMSLRHRFSRPTEFSIRIQGYQVGALDLFSPDESALCSGRFADRCQIVGDGRLTVVPRNSGKPVSP